MPSSKKRSRNILANTCTSTCIIGNRRVMSNVDDEAYLSSASCCRLRRLTMSGCRRGDRYRFNCGRYSSIENNADDDLDDVEEFNRLNDLGKQYDAVLLRLISWTNESKFASLPFSNKRDGENGRNDTKEHIISSSDMEEAFLDLLDSSDFHKRSKLHQPQKTTDEEEALKLLLSSFSSMMNVSKNEHHRTSRYRDRNVASRNQWMSLRRRRRQSLHHRYKQWKNEQNNFLMNSPDESILGKLEYQTCMTCQQKLGEMNVQLIREHINKLDVELHQLFSSKYTCIFGGVDSCHCTINSISRL
jgi:uncharacterized protein with PIN domain